MIKSSLRNKLDLAFLAYAHRANCDSESTLTYIYQIRYRKISGLKYVETLEEQVLQTLNRHQEDDGIDRKRNEWFNEKY